MFNREPVVSSSANRSFTVHNADAVMVANMAPGSVNQAATPTCDWTQVPGSVVNFPSFMRQVQMLYFRKGSNSGGGNKNNGMISSRGMGGGLGGLGSRGNNCNGARGCNGNAGGFSTNNDFGLNNNGGGSRGNNGNVNCNGARGCNGGGVNPTSVSGGNRGNNLNSNNCNGRNCNGNTEPIMNNGGNRGNNGVPRNSDGGNRGNNNNNSNRNNNGVNVAMGTEDHVPGRLNQGSHSSGSMSSQTGHFGNNGNNAMVANSGNRPSAGIVGSTSTCGCASYRGSGIFQRWGSNWGNGIGWGARRG